MSKLNVERLFSRLKFNIKPEPQKIRNRKGPEGRLQKISKTLTALIKYERIELTFLMASETRGYVDLLISEALRYGPEHKETMELANFWILEKQLIHKLFKVLVPRYQNYTTSFTQLYNLPHVYPGPGHKRAVLELRGNIYPSMEQSNPHQYNLIHNMLLEAARKEYRMTKYKETAAQMNLQQCSM